MKEEIRIPLHAASHEDKIKAVLAYNGPTRVGKIRELTKMYIGSEKTIYNVLRKLEMEGKVIRTYTPGEGRPYYQLVEKEYLVYTAFAQKHIQDAHNEAMRQLGKEYTESEMIAEVTYQYSKLFFRFFAAFPYDIAFHLTAFILDDYRLFAKNYLHLEEVQKKVKQLNDEWTGIQNLSVEELQTKIRKQQIRSAKDSLEDLEKCLVLLQTQRDEGIITEEDYKEKEHKLLELISEQKRRVEELSNSINSRLQSRSP